MFLLPFEGEGGAVIGSSFLPSAFPHRTTLFFWRSALSPRGLFPCCQLFRFLPGLGILYGTYWTTTAQVKWRSGGSLAAHQTSGTVVPGLNLAPPYNDPDALQDHGLLM